jgi:hypothetical protein
MQDADVEVESNVLAVDRLRNKADADKRRGRSEASTSGSSVPHPQVDELTKMVKSLSAEMEKMKFEGKQSYKNAQNADNRGNFRRPNFSPQILPRNPGTEIETIKGSRLLFRTTLLLVRKGGNR